MHLYAHGHTCPACMTVEEFVQTSFPAEPQHCRCQRCGCVVEHVADEPDANALLLRRWEREDKILARAREWR